MIERGPIGTLFEIQPVICKSIKQCCKMYKKKKPLNVDLFVY